jgi:hypothetical protein
MEAVIMAYTCPTGYMPLGEAYTEALSVLEQPDAILRQINESTTDDARREYFEKYDIMERRVERRLRNDIYDGHLLLFIKTPDNQIERVIDREAWQPEAFGIPGIDSVAHPLTSPGVDTDGQPVLVRIDNFRERLTAVRHEINPFRSGAPGKPSSIRLVEAEHQRRLASGESLESVGDEAAHLKDWLNHHYPDAPKTTKKTIENRIRAAHRGRSLTSRPSGP